MNSLAYQMQKFLRHDGNLLPDGSMKVRDVALAMGATADMVAEVAMQVPHRFGHWFPADERQWRVRALRKHSVPCNLGHPMWGQPYP